MSHWDRTRTRLKQSVCCPWKQKRSPWSRVSLPSTSTGNAYCITVSTATRLERPCQWCLHRVLLCEVPFIFCVSIVGKGQSTETVCASVGVGEFICQCVCFCRSVLVALCGRKCLCGCVRVCVLSVVAQWLSVIVWMCLCVWGCVVVWVCMWECMHAICVCVLVCERVCMCLWGCVRMCVCSIFAAL